LTIIINGKIKDSFQAVSGRPQKINGKHYFTHEKERQTLKNEGPIPEGEYYIEINKISSVPPYRLDRQYGWCDKNVPTELNKQEIYGRYGFYIHGGAEAGSAGCIDLWKNNNEFFKVFLELVEQYKDIILKNQGKIPLSVKYQDSTKAECDDGWKLELQYNHNFKFKTPFLFTTKQCRIL